MASGFVVVRDWRMHPIQESVNAYWTSRQQGDLDPTQAHAEEKAETEDELLFIRAKYIAMQHVGGLEVWDTLLESEKQAIFNDAYALLTSSSSSVPMETNEDDVAQQGSTTPEMPPPPDDDFPPSHAPVAVASDWRMRSIQESVDEYLASLEKSEDERDPEQVAKENDAEDEDKLLFVRAQYVAAKHVGGVDVWETLSAIEKQAIFNEIMTLLA
jgi:hypothetical protein